MKETMYAITKLKRSSGRCGLIERDSEENNRMNGAVVATGET